MAEISANLIKELRERTGIGMGKCKEALVEANGDMELAITNLRKAGMVSAVKKQGRETKEGLIGTSETADCIAIVEINSETDFVAKNARFQHFVKDMAAEIAHTKPASLEAFLKQKFSKEKDLTIDEYRGTIVQAIGENIQIKRLKVIPKKANHSFALYSHHHGKLVTMAELAGSSTETELARSIAMHISFGAPEYLSPEQVPAKVVEHERDTARGQMKNKPPAIVEKIVEGKVNAYYDANCLLRQKYIKDESHSVAEIVSKRGKEIGKPLTLVSFLRWSVGEAQA